MSEWGRLGIFLESFLDLRKLCGSNQKTHVHNLEERKKKLVFEVCRKEKKFLRKMDFSEKFAKVSVSHVTMEKSYVTQKY